MLLMLYLLILSRSGPSRLNPDKISTVDARRCVGITKKISVAGSGDNLMHLLPFDGNVERPAEFSTFYTGETILH